MARPRVLVTIDTSMSMTDAELAEIAKQLALLAEEARITVVECDSEIQRVYPFTGALTDVQGRGGTDLRKVFAESFWRAHMPDGVCIPPTERAPSPRSRRPCRRSGSSRSRAISRARGANARGSSGAARVSLHGRGRGVVPLSERLLCARFLSTTA